MSWLAGAERVGDPELALLEVDAAIAMVARGFAVSIRLVNVPAVEEVAFDAAARAQAAGVRFTLDRDWTGAVTMLVGPRAGLVDAKSVAGSTHGAAE